jgi:hypothetical protein
MKTIIFSLAMILVFYNNFLFASNPSITKERNFITKNDALFYLPKETTLQLAPVTPTEATFEDADKIGSKENNGYSLKKIAPITPKEATFEEVLSIPEINIPVFSTIVPVEATFEDSIGQ